MKTFRFLLRGAIFCFAIFYSLRSSAQQTTMGTDFWLGFIDFFDNTVTVDVRISSSVAASGTVAVPGQAWSTPFNVAANATTTVNIPIATVFVGTSETISPRGIHITSNNIVSVMATTNSPVRSETSLILSTPVLSTQYYVASYAPGNYNFTSEFLVVATANGTTVDITPSIQTAGGKPANTTFSINMNAGDVYQVKAGSSGTKDLTGSKVSVSANTPCKTIAVFSGMSDAYVPATVCATANPLFEEMNPVSVWGTDYVVTPYYTSTGCQVRIIASQANTSVSVDGGAPFNLNAGQFNEQSFNGSAHCITANKPIEVVQYMKGNACSGATPNKGDPSMMILNSNAQLISQVVFSPFNTGMASRSVNVVMQTANVGQLTLDGVAIGAGAFTAAPCAGYSYARINITNAFHTLAAAGGFVSYLYGYGSGDDGFSNPLGWSINLPSPITPVIAGNTSICTGGSTTLNAGNTYTTYSWSPGGQTSSAITVTPVSTTTYTLSVTSSCGSGSGTVKVTVTAPPTPTITGTTTVCSGNSTILTANGGGTYNWSTGSTTTSITVSPSSNTTYTVTANSGGCTGATTVAITISPGSTPTISGGTNVCPGQSTTLTANGGSTYSWSTGETTTTITITPASTTTYTLITNSGGCTGSTTVQVTVGSGLTPSITGTTSICMGSNTTLTGTGGGTYLWNTGATTTAITVSPAITTSYSVTVTNGTCTGTAIVQVNISTPPSPTITGTTTICNGTGTALTASGGTTYVWSTTETSQSITVSPSVQTTYTVIASTNGCTGVTTVVVTITAAPTPSITGMTTICAGLSSTLTASGGGTYAWSTGDLTATTTVSPITTTTYTVTVTTGCTATATVQVTVQSNLIPIITGTTAICNGTSTTLTTTGGGTYAWSDGTTNSSITVNPTTNTTYSVTVTNGLCSGTASQQITVNQNPNPVISGTTTICAGQSTTLTANAGGNYLWDTGAATAEITVSPTTSTNYTVVVITNGCAGSATAQVIVNPSPAPVITGTTSICNGQSTTLTSSTAGPYTWNTGATTNTITVTPTATTAYNVSVTVAGCTGTSNITVNVIPPVVANIVGGAICEGQTATLTASGGTNYLWNTGSTTNPLTDNPIVTTTYTVIASTGSCTNTASYIVLVSPIPTATASGSTTINYGNSASLKSSGGGTYNWIPSTGLSCSNCANPIASPTATTQYCVITTLAGCADSACVTVIVDLKCGFEGELFVPNGFSPNDDGQNDVLYVRGAGITGMFWVIYDRWGEKVFETSNPKQGWDGTYKGKLMDPAVFVYYLEVTCITGDQLKQKGNVAIIK